MQVRDVMVPSLEHLDPEMPMSVAAGRLKGHLETSRRVALPVLRAGKIVGVLSADMIRERATQAGLASAGILVRDVMSRDRGWCFVDESIEEATQLLRELQLARLPVVERDGRLVGVFAPHDVSGTERAEPLAQAHAPAAAGSVGSASDLVGYEEDRVDYMSEESFPASDPPAHSLPAGEDISGSPSFSATRE